MIRICFVCLGNICRSPTAEGVMRHLVEQAGLSLSIEVDSAGTGAYHAGERPDKRSVSVAKRRGITVSGRARQITAEDFDRFDYVLALDGNNYADLARLKPEACRAQLRMLLSFDPESEPNASVPDPYFGGGVGFEHVLDLCERACSGLLDHILATQALERR